MPWLVNGLSHKSPQRSIGRCGRHCCFYLDISVNHQFHPSGFFIPFYPDWKCCICISPPSYCQWNKKDFALSPLSLLIIFSIIERRFCKELISFLLVFIVVKIC